MAFQMTLHGQRHSDMMNDGAQSTKVESQKCCLRAAAQGTPYTLEIAAAAAI